MRALQVLPVKGMDIVARSTSSRGDVFVAAGQGSAGIRRLAPLPFADQAAMLADREDFAAALELAALVPASEVRPSLLLNCCSCRKDQLGILFNDICLGKMLLCIQPVDQGLHQLGRLSDNMCQGKVLLCI